MGHVPTGREVEMTEKLSCWLKAVQERFYQERTVPPDVSDKSVVAAPAAVFRYVDVVHSCFVDTVTDCWS